VGPGSAVPTVLVLVPMLFVLPPGLAPTCVALGLVCGGLLDRIRRGLRIERLTVLLCSSWHSVGPAVVIALYAPGPPSWQSIRVYVLALGAQFVLDGAATALRQCVGRGVALTSLARPLALVWLVDCTLAPIALAIAAVATSEPAVVVCALPLAGLLHVLAGERKRYIDDNVKLGEAVESASRAAMSDPLTGLGNRRAWSDALARLMATEGATTPVSVLLVDLNGLKKTNDTHGHDVGDRVIQALATALVRALPKGTVVARIGGDEFAVLLAHCGHEQAMLAAAGVRREVARTTVGGVQVSASIGHASSPPCTSVDVALLRADEELYRAKALQGHVRSRSRTGSGVRLGSRPGDALSDP